jgi:PAS domain S-box-containing protein
VVNSSSWHPAARHAAVFGITAGATAISALFSFWIEPAYFLPLIGAVALCAWFFGRGGGIHAAIAGAILADFFLFEPRYAFAMNAGALAGVGAFIATAVLIMRLISLLRRSQDLQTSILEGMTDAVVVTDTRGSIAYLNPAAEALSGLESARAANQPFTEVFPLRDADTGQLLGTTASTQSGAHILLVAKDGTEYSVEESSAPIRGRDGRITGGIIVLRNVSRRRQMQDQLTQSQKMEAIARLAGGVAGDFNNLLTVITGFGELLTAEMKPGDPLRRFAEEILGAAERAAGLARQLLAFGKGPPATAQPHDLNALVVSMKTMLSRMLGPSIDVVVLADARSSRVKTDPGQIEQIVANLAMNARDAMPSGGRFVIGTSDFETQLDAPGPLPDLPPGQYVMLTVSDTGIGMDAETRSRLFEPFFTTKGRGPGLGLSTVYGIVKQHGGRITVYSQPAAGTIFEIYFPRAKDMPDLVPKRRLRGPRGSETILIADDEEAVRKLVHAVLATSGYTVIEARDGAEALSLFEQQRDKIDMVLTDVVMPQMNGYELASRIEGLDPRKKIMFMSGFQDAHVGGDFERTHPFLSKPFTPEVLLKQVRATLNARSDAA